MDHPLIDLINARIAKAEAEGAFDNLPGAGRPLPEVADPESALLDRLLREAGAVPEFVTLSKTLAALRAELRAEGDRTRRGEILREISMLEIRIDLAKQAYRR
ncbi:J-domain-containing protein [Frigidibacter sp. MR17.24]|uniref:DnaJ family domain-containing protein n=1 Tax=Frigidibacter sp. MR17.24 TaxID=3127345 RepID=UPI003012C852